jgi:hypothetical protein
MEEAEEAILRKVTGTNAAGNTVSMESSSVPESESKLMTFDSEKHLRKKKVDEVKSFGDSTVTSAQVSNDFVL